MFGGVYPTELKRMLAIALFATLTPAVDSMHQCIHTQRSSPSMPARVAAGELQTGLVFLAAAATTDGLQIWSYIKRATV